MLISNVNDQDQLDGLIDNSTHEAYDILGFSGGRYTVGFSCLSQTDCYDNQGRFVSIWSGLASVNNAMRPIIIEKDPGRQDILPHFSPSSLAPGSPIEPHYRPSTISIYTSVFLDEKSILVQFKVGSKKNLASTYSFMRGFESLVGSRILRCPHDCKERYRVENNQNLVLSGFDFPQLLQRHENDNATTLFALHGNKLEQIFMAENARSGSVVFQLLACLKCCILAALSDGNPDGSCVIMGG